MNKLTQLEELIGKEYFVQSAETIAFGSHDEKNSMQANNNRIVDLSNLRPSLEITI